MSGCLMFVISKAVPVPASNMKMAFLVVPHCWRLTQNVTTRACCSLQSHTPVCTRTLQQRNTASPHTPARNSPHVGMCMRHFCLTPRLHQSLGTKLCFVQSHRYCSADSDHRVSMDSGGGNKEYLSSKIEALTEDIVSKISVKYGDHDSTARNEISAKLQSFIDHGLPFQVLDKIEEFPEVLHRSEQFAALLKALTDMGMSKKALAKMISSDPAVMLYSKSTVMEAFYKLLNLGFTCDLIVTMFVKQPQIITVNLDGVAQRIEDLKLLFNTKHTFSLITNNPGLLFTDLEEIRTKFMYVYNEMGVTQPQMMHTQIFNYSLEHIHTRHMFAVRTGFFKIVKEKDKFKNAKLDVILDTSDAAFAKKFGGLSVKDYRCFEALLLKEELLYGGGRGGKVEDHDNDNLGDLDDDGDVDQLKDDSYQYT